jgi:hypothetical protein
MRFVDVGTLQVNEGELYNVAVQNGLAGSIGELTAALSKLPAADAWSICQGHDLLKLLTFGLRGVLGKLKPGRNETDVAGLLRQSHEVHDLLSSYLGQSIRSWESRNPPFLVLPQTIAS